MNGNSYFYRWDSKRAKFCLCIQKPVRRLMMIYIQSLSTSGFNAKCRLLGDKNPPCSWKKSRMTTTRLRRSNKAPKCDIRVLFQLKTDHSNRRNYIQRWLSDHPGAKKTGWGGATNGKPRGIWPSPHLTDRNSIYWGGFFQQVCCCLHIGLADAPC